MSSLVKRCLAVACLFASAASAQAPPSPDDFAGFPIGSDGNLLRWERIVEYFRMLDEASDRVLVQELGKTTNGNPFIVAKISSPENIARLDAIQAAQKRIADPRGLSAEQGEEIAWNSPAVAMVSGNVHAMEIGASQFALELGYRLATDDSAATRHILDNVVLLLVPSLNPDGQILATDWNERIRDPQHRWASMPWLSHPYVGHDSNRDAFMMTQVESRYVNRLLFQDWFPQVYLDQHQQGAAGMRVFVPPFRNPINPNVDPAIWSEIGQLGFAMYQRLHEAGFNGVGYDQTYTAWWQGGFLRGAWFHNMVGLLTEVASANLSMPVMQQFAELGKPARRVETMTHWRQKRELEPEAPLPPPRDVMPRYDYPRPWLGGRWTLRNIIDAEWALTQALLETTANERVKLIETQIRLGREAVEAGRDHAPWAFVFPNNQHDPGALYRLLEALHYCGIEVERAKAPFQAGDQDFNAGSYVIRMAQPFRAYAKDLLEPQQHPDPSLMPAGSMGEQPYDLTAWSLPLQMGVETHEVSDAFDVELERLEEIPHPVSRISGVGEPSGFLVRPEPNALAKLINRLQKADVRLELLEQAAVVHRRAFAPGSLWVEGVPQGELAAMTADLGLEAYGVERKPSGRWAHLRAPRTALYQPWTASIDEGWTRWLLEQYEFPFTTLQNADIRQGTLEDRWDVIILPGDRDDSQLALGNRRPSTPEEYRGGLGAEGREALRKFVAKGGTLVVWGDAIEFARNTFELPLVNELEGVSSERFSAPGSFLHIELDNTQPLAYGMRRDAVAVFNNDVALELAPGADASGVEVAARYPNTELLASGWLKGEELLAGRIAAAEVAYRKGRVALAGFRPQFRAQSDNTFKFLFNAIFRAGIDPRD